MQNRRYIYTLSEALRVLTAAKGEPKAMPMDADEAIETTIEYGKALQANATMHRIGKLSSAAGHQRYVDRTLAHLNDCEEAHKATEAAIREAFEVRAKAWRRLRGLVVKAHEQDDGWGHKEEPIAEELADLFGLDIHLDAQTIIDGEEADSNVEDDR